MLVVFLSGSAGAVTFSWNVNTSGVFNSSSNWAQTSIGVDVDGVPDADDAVILRRGSGVVYSVNFPGVAGRPVDYVTDRLLVGSNNVTFTDQLFDAASTYAVDNAITAESGRGIIIGVAASDIGAVLTSRLPTFSGAAATIGDAADSNGTLNIKAGTFSVTGADAANLELIVGRSGAGAINVTSGAGVFVVGDAVLGENAGSSGTAAISGVGSTWNNGNNSIFASSGVLTVGSAGAGTLAITDGGSVSCNDGSLMGNTMGSTGLATVDGAGSKWTVFRYLYLGVSGAATLNVAHAGQVDLRDVLGGVDVYVGKGIGSTGAVNVTTAGLISSGSPTSDAPSPVYIAAEAGSVGTVAVDGTGSKWANSGAFLVGELGNGTLTITNGGQVDNTNQRFNAAYGSIADGAGSTGAANVAGAGSMWINSASLYVGNAGAGSLTLTAGGQVSDATGYIGNESGSAGTATVDGAGSTWNNSASLYVGVNGAGNLNVANHGTVTVVGLLIVGMLGEVHGNGFVTGHVYNGGLVSPGNSPGALHVTGDFTQAPLGKLQIELAGATPGTQYDQLLITGSATLAGTLQISLLSGFAPSSGDSFDLLTATSDITGTFANQQLPVLSGGLVWTLSYGPNDVILSVGGVLGDYNHNGIVDAADYTIWRDTLGQMGTGLAADGDQNGKIEQADFNFWKSNFGMHAGSGSSAAAYTAVPEPSTLVMLIIAAAVIRLRRRQTGMKRGHSTFPALLA